MKNHIIDLFSGCGGFALGAEFAGFSSILSVDIDSDLQSSYSKNFPSSEIVTADVNKLDRSYWNRKLNGLKVDGLIGGPPCQGFSYIGKRAQDDPRNDLIRQFYKQVSFISPKFFIMENVQGLVDKSRVGILNSGIDSLSKRYRVLDPMIVNASDYGAATNRKRVIVVGYDPEYVEHIDPIEFLPSAKIKMLTVKDAINDLPGPLDYKIKGDYHWGYYPKSLEKEKGYAKKSRTIFKGLGCVESISKLKNGMTSGLSPTRHSVDVINRFKSLPQGHTDKISRFPRLSWTGKCPTLRAGTGKSNGGFQSVRPIHPVENRVITVREAARLQGFPDWFLFHHTKWHSFRMIGNSVCPIVSEYLHRVIYSKLKS